MKNSKPFTNLCGLEFDGVKRYRDMDKDCDNKRKIHASLDCFELQLGVLIWRAWRFVISGISNKEQVWIVESKWGSCQSPSKASNFPGWLWRLESSKTVGDLGSLPQNQYYSSGYLVPVSLIIGKTARLIWGEMFPLLLKRLCLLFRD